MIAVKVGEYAKHKYWNNKNDLPAELCKYVNREYTFKGDNYCLLNRLKS